MTKDIWDLTDEKLTEIVMDVERNLRNLFARFGNVDLTSQSKRTELRNRAESILASITAWETLENLQSAVRLADCEDER